MVRLRNRPTSLNKRVSESTLTPASSSSALPYSQSTLRASFEGQPALDEEDTAMDIPQTDSGR